MRSNVFELVRTLVAVFLSLLIVFIFIVIVSKDPVRAYRLFLIGPFARISRLAEWLNQSIPLLFAGLAVAIVFQANQFSIGAEGQFLIGALGATMVALSFPEVDVIHLLVAILAGMLCGALWGVIPGLLSAYGLKEGDNLGVLVVSLMMNFIGFYTAYYTINNHFRDIYAGFMASPFIPSTSYLPFLSARYRINGGLVIAFIIAGLVWYFLYRTKWGYEIRMVGTNIGFASFNGINVKRVIIYSNVISAAVAGLAGAIEVTGLHHRYLWQSMPGYGFDGVIIALIARNNPALVPLSALFVAYLRTGGRVMERGSDVSAEMAMVLESIIVLLVTAEALLNLWQRKRLKRKVSQR
ncbi:MAG: Inner-membrane translocator [Acetothermia bacterium 64_32]|nr:MAG: Inner-membrane translocator [Acetothermia bacterium 64_32]